jgi:hypothetical protein
VNDCCNLAHSGGVREVFTSAQATVSAGAILTCRVDTLRIGTWNADHAKPSRNGGRLDVLRQFHADIWVLTETRDDLKPGDNYCPTHSAMQLGTRAERWVTIWSRSRLPLRLVG